MGNQLVGIAPSQIFPVEHYLTDHLHLKFDASLGSTRFFKVARAKSQEGLIVVKVFAIHDPTLPLSTHKEKLEEIRSKLATAVNCLPFQKIVLTEKAGYIMREYVKYSLYDRISTRPFLSTIEKKWITFQVLYSLHQVHKLGVCHGDIKLENIMITSWNWVLLTDFASFKPTYLPEDNPADFSYFFDTSRRRTCYIAPERFVKTLTSETTNTLLFPEQELKKGDLQPMMDIFSAGCALIELYNEGHSPFDFSQLLAYRNGEYSPSKHLDNIEDAGIRELLASMIEKNPANRKTAELYLSQTRNKVFPEYFYGFLQSYMQIFSAAPLLSPDEKINRLKKDIGNITSMFKNKIEEAKQDSEDSQFKEDVKPKLTKKSSGQIEENVMEDIRYTMLNRIKAAAIEARKSDLPDSLMLEKGGNSGVAALDYSNIPDTFKSKTEGKKTESKDSKSKIDVKSELASENALIEDIRCTMLDRIKAQVLEARKLSASSSSQREKQDNSTGTTIDISNIPGMFKSKAEGNKQDSKENALIEDVRYTMLNRIKAAVMEARKEDSPSSSTSEKQNNCATPTIDISNIPGMFKIKTEGNSAMEDIRHTMLNRIKAAAMEARKADSPNSSTFEKRGNNEAATIDINNIPGMLKIKTEGNSAMEDIRYTMLNRIKAAAMEARKADSPNSSTFEKRGNNEAATIDINNIPGMLKNKTEGKKQESDDSKIKKEVNSKLTKGNVGQSIDHALMDDVRLLIANKVEAQVQEAEEKARRTEAQAGEVEAQARKAEDPKSKSDAKPEIAIDYSSLSEDKSLVENIRCTMLDRIKAQVLEARKLSVPSSLQHDKQDNSKVSLKVKSEKVSNDEEGLVIITQLVTSCIRGLHHAQAKLQSLEILLELAENTSDETILDRILPYIFLLVHDHAPRVRVSAIHTLTKCLYIVKQIPPSDVNIFSEYILPGLAHLTQDQAVIVRVAYAENIAHLAHIAFRYLESSHLSMKENEGVATNYDSELQTLHEMVQQSVSSLLTDQHNVVKRTLIENGISKLCIFFGKLKANDVLLSHIITFLNDKDDSQLRQSFFECIVDVAANIGYLCSPILMPLLQQGLTDPEEFVITKAIKAMAALTELGLIQKFDLYQLLQDTVVYLVHPNFWIRHADVGFVSASARSLNIVDVQIQIQPMIQPYIKHQLMQIEKDVFLYEALVSPIPRAVFDAVVTYSEIIDLFRIFEQRKIARVRGIHGIIPQYDMNIPLRNLLRRLNSESMTDIVEDQLLSMKAHLIKINKYRTPKDMKQSSGSADGKLELGSAKNKINYNIASLHADTKSDISLPSFKKLDRKTSDSSAVYASMNQEWRTMFASQENQNSATAIKTTDISASGGSPSQSIHGCDIHPSPQHTSLTDTTNSINDHSMHERSYIQYRCAPCRLELRQLTCRKQEQYIAAVRAQHWAENMAWQADSGKLPSGWKPRGSLIAFLHEHTGTVNRLVPIPETHLFASSSADGCVKIWDTNKMEGKNIANRSRQTYVHRCGPLVGLVACEQGQSLASATTGAGNVFVLRIEPNSSKMTVVSLRQLDMEEDGGAVDVQYLDSGSQSVIVYGTVFGSLVGWDTRCPGTAWNLKNDMKDGLITSFCINNYQQWLTLGTSSGVHVCWDLRFQLPISKFEHPTSARVRKLITHPTEPSWVISSVHSNNEISMWNLETSSRQMVLWASSAPPLSQTQGGQSVYAMHSGCVDETPFLLSAGSDMRLRFWNLQLPTESRIVLPAANDLLTPDDLVYEQRLIDGTNVVQEMIAPPHVDSSSESNASMKERNCEEGSPGPDVPNPGHHAIISAVTMSKSCIITGSYDGLIQVWK